MDLLPARAPGADAVRGGERVQVKAMRVPPGKDRPRPQAWKIAIDISDILMLAVLDRNFDVVEVWEAPFAKVADELRRPGSNARTRGQLGFAKFRKVSHGGHGRTVPKRRPWSPTSNAVAVADDWCARVDF